MQSDSHLSAEPSASDLQVEWGASNIAKLINRTERQFYHMAASGALDGVVMKIGSRYCADRVRLIQRFRPPAAE